MCGGWEICTFCLSFAVNLKLPPKIKSIFKKSSDRSDKVIGFLQNECVGFKRCRIVKVAGCGCLLPCFLPLPLIPFQRAFWSLVFSLVWVAAPHFLFSLATLLIKGSTIRRIGT